MSKSFFRQFQNEDWIATLMGLLLVVTVIVLPGLIPVFPKELNTVGAWLSILGLLVVALLVSALGVRLLGERLKGFLPAFVAIFVLSVLCMLLSGIPAIKRTGFESVFFSVILACLPVKNLPCRKSAQISARDALFTTAPYRLHRSV